MKTGCNQQLQDCEARNKTQWQTELPNVLFFFLSLSLSLSLIGLSTLSRHCPALRLTIMFTTIITTSLGINYCYFCILDSYSLRVFLFLLLSFFFFFFFFLNSDAAWQRRSINWALNSAKRSESVFFFFILSQCSQDNVPATTDWFWLNAFNAEEVMLNTFLKSLRHLDAGSFGKFCEGS